MMTTGHSWPLYDHRLPPVQRDKVPRSTCHDSEHKTPSPELVEGINFVIYQSPTMNLHPKMAVLAGGALGGDEVQS
jgi:hypothetical protein